MTTGYNDSCLVSCTFSIAADLHSVADATWSASCRTGTRAYFNGSGHSFFPEPSKEFITKLLDSGECTLARLRHVEIGRLKKTEFSSIGLKTARASTQSHRESYIHGWGKLIEGPIRNHQMGRNRPRYERQEQQRLPKPMDED